MYLVVETQSKNNYHQFTHFIDLRKDKIESELKEFMEHIKRWDEKPTKIYFSTEKMSQW